jgi:hypothetical protein
MHCLMLMILVKSNGVLETDVSRVDMSNANATSTSDNDARERDAIYKNKYLRR